MTTEKTHSPVKIYTEKDIKEEMRGDSILEIFGNEYFRYVIRFGSPKGTEVVANLDQSMFCNNPFPIQLSCPMLPEREEAMPCGEFDDLINSSSVLTYTHGSKRITLSEMLWKSVDNLTFKDRKSDLDLQDSVIDMMKTKILYDINLAINPENLESIEVKKAFYNNRLTMISTENDLYSDPLEYWQIKSGAVYCGINSEAYNRFQNQFSSLIRRCKKSLPKLESMVNAADKIILKEASPDNHESWNLNRSRLR